jgi:hypothetical protein
MKTASMLLLAALAVLPSAPSRAQSGSAEECAALGDKLNKERLNEPASAGSVRTHYSPRADRCYVALDRHSSGAEPGSANYHASLFLFDGRTRQQIAFTRIEGGNKLGMIFDPKHSEKLGADKGFSDATDYIRQKMTDE